MTLFKNEFPILEFDDRKDAVINPNHEVLNLKLPKKCVYVFLADHVDEYARKNKAVKVSEFVSATKVYPVYVIDYKGEKVTLAQAPGGSAAAAQFMDWLISYEVREIISAGTCGALVDIDEGVFLIPTRALRDEGASYHYMAPSRFVEIDRRAISPIRKTFEERGLTYLETTTWSTDGFYRETKDFVKYRIEEGCQVVEMECASLAAVASFRDVIWGDILFTADTLSDPHNYDQRNWAEDSFAFALELALDSVIKIGKVIF